MALAEVWDPLPWETADNSFDQSADMPDVIEYVLSPQYLDKTTPGVYPRQATLLKLIFLQDELLTEYDHEVIDEWTRISGFQLPPEERWVSAEPIHYEGQHGLPPDIFERIDILKGQGRRWFNEILNVTGRRGGKGYIGGLCGSYVMWHYHRKKDPQAWYGVEPSKKLGCYVFAGKRDQAKGNQWRDLVDVLINAPCYEKFIETSTSELLTVAAPTDAEKLRKLLARGIKTEMDMATFQVVPKESTLMAGRGPALFIIFFDEMAHVVATGANRSAEEVYDAATPALDQFGVDAFKYAGSSPWQMMGKFYELCQQALEIEQDESGAWHPVYPEKLLIQLTSWDPYEDWERSRFLPLVPDDYAEALADGAVEGRLQSDYYMRDSEGKIVKRFVRIKRAIQTYDENMVKLERANPETFAVERRCLDPDTRVLKADLTWVPIGKLQPGDKVISVDDQAESGKERKMRTATVLHSWTNRDRAYRINFEDGTNVVCSANHRWLSASASSPASFRWRHLRAAPSDPGPREIIKPGDTIRFLVDPWEREYSWLSGYLAGVYDGEGTAVCRDRSEWRVDFTQNPGEVLDATLAYLRASGFEPIHVKTGDRRAQCYKIVGFATMMRFIGELGPHKLRRQAIPKAWEGRGLPKLNGKSSSKMIASIEELPEQDLIDIETTTGTFIAEGLVSHNSHWATAQDAYLNPTFVDEMFQPFFIPGVDPEEPKRILTNKSEGPLNIIYVAHGDPSQSGKNFGWVVAHKEGPDDRGLYHVIFDKIHYWSPQQWEDGRQDYFAIADEIMADIKGFNPSEVTFDQKDSFMMIQKLQKETYALKLPKRVDIYERTATRQLNWAMAEVYKTSLGMGLLHAPYHELFDLENKFLQDLGGKVDHPTMGPVQTKDIWDAATNCVWGLIGDQMAAFIKTALAGLEMRFSGENVPGGDPAGTAAGAKDADVMSQFEKLGRARGVREGAPRGGWTPRAGAAARRRT